MLMLYILRSTFPHLSGVCVVGNRCLFLRDHRARMWEPESRLVLQENFTRDFTRVHVLVMLAFFLFPTKNESLSKEKSVPNHILSDHPFPRLILLIMLNRL